MANLTQITALRAAIDADPAYSTMKNAAASAAFNVEDQTRIRASLSGDEIFKQTDETEFAALADIKKQIWVSFCARDVIDPGAAANLNLVKWVFGAGSATLAALKAARDETISLGVEIGFGFVGEGDVEDARKL